MEPILIANGLRKTFTLSKKQQQLEKTNQKVKVAVDGLSFTANKGEIFGLLGPNGAGKTTTLRMLATLIRPDEGDATLDGISVVKDPDAVRSHVASLIRTRSQVRLLSGPPHRHHRNRSLKTGSLETKRIAT